MVEQVFDTRKMQVHFILSEKTDNPPMYFFVDCVKTVIILSSQIDNGLQQKEKRKSKNMYEFWKNFIILILVGEFLQSAVPVKLIIFLTS